MEKKMLVIIDFINEFIHKDGKLAYCNDYIAKNSVIDNLITTIKWAEKNKISVVYAITEFDENYTNCLKNSPILSKVPQLNALKKGSWGSKIIDELPRSNQDVVITKTGFGALNEELLEYTKKNGIKKMYLTGSIVSFSVESTVRSAHDIDLKTIVISDACGAVCDATKESSLKFISKISHIITSNQLENNLS